MRRVGPVPLSIVLAWSAMAGRCLAAASGDQIFGSGLEPHTLTVNDYFSWCNVSINGGTPTSTATTQTAVDDASVVSLHAEPLAGFIWGYWTGTDNVDLATNKDTTQTTTVTMYADRSVFVCCPFASGAGCP